VETLCGAGIRLAFGHFRRDNPPKSARAIAVVVGIVEHALGSQAPNNLLTDHLFNDTPLRFKHVWRSPESRSERAAQLASYSLDWDSLAVVLGDVPAALLRLARDDRLTVCLNFDGEHVDLEICRRVVELMGARRIIAMTDRIESFEMADERLTSKEGTTLRFQRSGIVAAGSQNLDQEMRNMRDIAISEADIWRMVSWNPLDALDAPGGQLWTLVTANYERIQLGRGPLTVLPNEEVHT